MDRLILGAGSSHKDLDGVRLDINPDHHPDVIWDLEQFPLPFHENLFDEIYAYEVLEHTGTQGDWRFFFAQFEEFYRILKPGGQFIASVPWHGSVWAFADPGHKRVIYPETLVFLNQEEYAKQVGVTAMSDYRWCYKADFTVEKIARNEHSMFFTLNARKG